ncbi:nitrilase-related carbon-nitrogen hydrolase [Azospirillum sp. ST 5-10]|uniref:nitrilase-related carbon-nitrogen hydrolase n=1 Tax=unclassified Azospirillum TaxID=2630922 RepID=UPI003F4A09CE
MTPGRLDVRVAQPDGPPAGHDAALDMVARTLRAAAGADLLVLPELALCGYGDAERVRRLAVGRDSDVVGRLRSLAAAAGTGLVAGFAERDGATLYNAAVAIAGDGALAGVYRKLNLWGDHERALFAPGAPSPVLPWNGFALGFLICHDLDGPETARDLVRRGADTLLALSATNDGYAVIPDALVRARAYENVSYLVYADAAGRDGDFVFRGHSRIVAPDGTVLAALDGTRPALAGARLTAAALAGWRRRHPYLRTAGAAAAS